MTPSQLQAFLDQELVEAWPYAVVGGVLMSVIIVGVMACLFAIVRQLERLRRAVVAKRSHHRRDWD